MKQVQNILSKGQSIDAKYQVTFFLKKGSYAETYRIKDQERKTLTLTSCSYTYRASAPGVLPDYGTENMQSNYEYEWSFYISTSRN